MEEFEYIKCCFPIHMDPSSRKYIDHILNSIERNYKEKDYLFSFIALHLALMSFIYICIFRFKKNEDEKELYDENYQNKFTPTLTPLKGENCDISKEIQSPFSFRQSKALKRLREKEVVNFLSVYDIDQETINTILTMIDLRNTYAHANNQVMELYNFELNVERICNIFDSIQKHLFKFLNELSHRFFKTYIEEEKIKTTNKEDFLYEFRKLVERGMFSVNDIDFLKKNFASELVNIEKDPTTINAIKSLICYVPDEI